MSRRREQFSSTLHRALGKVLATRLNDPRIAGMVTVVTVEVSPDHRHASVGVSVLPDKYEKRTLAGLQHAARHIQSLLHNEMRTRTMPQLHFEIDRSLKKQAEVLDAIRHAVAEDEQGAGGGAGEGGREGGQVGGDAPRPEAEAADDRKQSGSPSDPTNPAPEDRSP